MVFLLGLCRYKYLLISDSELSLCLLVVLSETLELFDRIALEDCDEELDILLRVLMTRLIVIISLPLPYNISDYSRKPWYHQAAQLASRSTLCASRQAFPRRTYHSLNSLGQP